MSTTSKSAKSVKTSSAPKRDTPSAPIVPQLCGLKEIVEKKTNEMKIAEYYKMLPLFDAVKAFAIKKGLIMYGGSAINEILPKDYKIYDQYTLPDYDFFSYQAKKHALEMSEYLVKLGFKYIEVKSGMHEGTYKVFAEFTPIADITQVTKNFYKFNLMHLSQNPVQNYSDKNLLVAPKVVLFWSFYRELSSPEGSLHRWEKLYARYLTFDKVFKLSKPPLKVKRNMTVLTQAIKDIHEQLLEMIKSRMFPVVGYFGFSIHKGTTDNDAEFDSYMSTYEILSENMMETFQQIKDALVIPTGYKLESSNRGSGTKYFADILPRRTRVYLTNKQTKLKYPVLTILEVSESCFSTTLKNGFNVGSIDTILNILYAYYMTYSFFKGPQEPIVARLEKIINNVTYFANTTYASPKERFSTDCFGRQKTLLNIRKENWEKKGFFYRPTGSQKTKSI